MEIRRIFIIIILVKTAFQNSGPTIDGRNYPESTTRRIVPKGGTLSSEMKYQWKVLVREKMRFLNSKQGYQDTLDNFGIDTSNIYTYLKPGVWSSLVKKLCSFALIMKDNKLKDVCNHFKVIPNFEQMRLLENSIDKNSKLYWMKSNVINSNTKTVDWKNFNNSGKVVRVLRPVPRSVGLKSMGDLWELLKENKEKHEKDKKAKTGEKRVEKVVEEGHVVVYDD